MGEEIDVDVEELERELRELREPEVIEIKPVAETTAVVTQAQAEERGEEKSIDLEILEKELKRAELLAEKKYLEKHGGLCHHVKLEKFSEPVTVCRTAGVHEDEEKLLVSLLYKYYPYAMKTLYIINEIKLCEHRGALRHGFDLVMFADPIRIGSLYYGGFGTMIAELAYVYELDIEKDRAFGVHIEVAIDENNKPSVVSVCKINEIHSLAYTLLKALRLPFVLDDDDLERMF
jgi:hypothetical protein